MRSNIGKKLRNRSRLFEIALVLVRFDHVASLIVNANHSSCERLRCFAYPIALRLHPVRRTTADRQQQLQR